MRLDRAKVRMEAGHASMCRQEDATSRAGVGDAQGMSTRLAAEQGDEHVRVEVELGSAEPLDELRGCVRRTGSSMCGSGRPSREHANGTRRGRRSDKLGVSKQAAWALYNDDVRETLSTVRQRSGLSDEQSQQSADDERDARRAR